MKKKNKIPHGLIHLSQRFWGKKKSMNGKVEIIKSAKRTGKKARIQFTDSATTESLRNLYESSYKCFTKNSSRMKDFIENVEREILIRALIQFNGSQKQASKFLGLKQSTMCMKCKKYGIISRIEPKLFSENSKHSRTFTLIIPEEKS